MSDEADDEPTCPECDGELVENDDDTYCRNCSVMVGTSETTDRTSPWTYFATNRPTYRYSERPRLVGGFPDAYEWVTSEEADGAVRDVDPTTFYR